MILQATKCTLNNPVNQKCIKINNNRHVFKKYGVQLGKTMSVKTELEGMLVYDTILMDLTERQALAYMEGHGHKMVDKTYRRKKKFVLSTKQNDKWLSTHAREGMAQNHRLMLDKIDLHMKEINRLFVAEVMKPDKVENKKGLKDEKGNLIMVNNGDKKKFLIIQLSRHYKDLLEVYAKLNIGTPVISQVMRQLNPNIAKELTDADIAKGFITI